MFAQCTTVLVFAGIDIGKNVNCFGGFAGLDCGPWGSPRTAHSARQGYDQFLIWIERYMTSPEQGPVIVGLELTGIYRERWAYALTRS